MEHEEINGLRMNHGSPSLLEASAFEGDIQEKKSRLNMLDDQIKEQKMTIEYNKKKLWKTQLGVAFLLLITVIHVATYREVKSNLETLVKDQTEILDRLE